MRVPQYRLQSLTDQNALNVLNNIIRQITFAVNSIEFGSVESSAENISCEFIVTDGTLGADKAASASHGLRRVPVGTICIWQDKAGIFYKPTDATSADTETAVFYICNTAATSAVLLVF